MPPAPKFGDRATMPFSAEGAFPAAQPSLWGGQAAEKLQAAGVRPRPIRYKKIERRSKKYRADTKKYRADTKNRYFAFYDVKRRKYFLCIFRNFFGIFFGINLVFFVF